MNRYLLIPLLLSTLMLAPLTTRGEDTLVWHEGFESFACRMSEWTFLDADGDGYGWTTEMSRLFFGHGSDSSIASASYIQGVGALQPDNWLISPAIAIPEAREILLSWYEKSQDPSYITEHYSVYISTSGSDIVDFGTPIFSHTTSDTGWHRRSVELTAYAGQTIRIAFRHHNSSDHYWLVLDDINIEAEYNPMVECIVSSNDPNMGSVTGGGTYPYGEEVVIGAIAAAHHRFVAWFDGNTENPRTVVLTQDTILTAIFVPEDTIGVAAAQISPISITSARGAILVSNAGSETVRIFDAAGRLLYSDGSSSDRRQIEISVPGIYLVQVGRSVPKRIAIVQ